ncbi:MAG TPA: tRNA epoxyqueuosine(34) reductase QueG [Bryobacteraceae bacterium]|nr:tRNA epoxyqueuosine(34) reductase QueG [Bryobacteraceae bacterium]
MRADVIRALARECGFELAGVAPALPAEPDYSAFLEWVAAGHAGRMGYLTDHRSQIRSHPGQLLPSARSIVCVGRLYNSPEPGAIARYAREEDYHQTMRRDLELLASKMQCEFGSFDYRVCVDTAPLLERSYARLAGLGWIGRNTCVINQQFGSYVFLGEILTSLDIDPGTPAPDRCGTCSRCIDACPTAAIVPGPLRTQIDSNRCISYLTIELKGDIPEDLRSGIGTNVFGCDICQEVCPWNSRAPVAGNAISPELEQLAELTPEQFRERFRNTPLWRTKYSGLLRNVAVAAGNSGDTRLRPVLEKLAEHEDPLIRSHAEHALAQLTLDAPEV